MQGVIMKIEALRDFQGQYK